MERLFRKKLLFLVRIVGESGWPFLIPGRMYLATSLRRPRIGDFVVFPNPKNQEQIFVKRVRTMREEGYEVESTVSWGSSSDEFGSVAADRIFGTLLWKIR